MGKLASIGVLLITVPVALSTTDLTTQEGVIPLSGEYAKTVWVATMGGLLKVAAGDGTIALLVPDIEEVRAVAVDERRERVWALADEALVAVSFDGLPVTAQPLPASVAADNGHAAITIVPDDGTLWVAAQKVLLHYDAQAALLGMWPIPENVVAIGLSPSTSLLWVATSSTLTTRDAVTGIEVAALDLGESPQLTDLSIDARTGAAWVATAEGLRRYEGGVLVLDVRTDAIRAVASCPGGHAWYATNKEIALIDATGVPLVRAPITSGEVRGLVADPHDASAWLARPDSIIHVRADGEVPSVTALPKHDDATGLALYADTLAPELRLLAPVDGAYLADALPEIEVEFDDIGSGVDPETLAFTANDVPLEVTCGTTGVRAACAPVVPFADGPVRLRATIEDLEGNVSEPAEATFSIDTTPPVITVAAPPDGLLTNQPAVALRGSLSETAVLTLNGYEVPIAEDLGFASETTLVEGPNAFALRAEDRAGNIGEDALAVTLDTQPPAAIDTDKVVVSSVTGGQVTVAGSAGSAEGSATVRATNERAGDTAAAQAGIDGSFSLEIPAQDGDTLSLVAVDGAGNASAAATVTAGGAALPPDPASVAPPLDLTVATNIFDATEFLYTGDDPIQTGVEPGTIEPRRAAVLRGKVKDRAGEPVPGVKIAVHGHPELGQTLSRADGMFDLVVNGGGGLVVSYSKGGLLPVRRQIETEWQQWGWLPDVVMIPLDEQVTTVDLTEPGIHVARGSLVTDEDGSRQATLLFPAGTTASLVMPDGSTQPVSTLHVRATEYTVGEAGPEAMPADLPANVAYTYCIELTADEAAAAGADHVAFNHPVINYVENFLDFPVGTAVPVGYYDRITGQWLASENGKVISVLNTDGGIAQLDVTGDGTADPPDVLGLLGIAETEQRAIAATYPAGASLSRVPRTHFSTVDYNLPYGAPLAEYPGCPPPEPVDRPVKDPCTTCGSIIDIQNQALDEEYALVGTPYRLHYASSRVPGRMSRVLRIQLSGTTVPPSLKRIDLLVTLAGRREQHSFPPTPGRVFELVWDGRDSYGRETSGPQPVQVAIAYVYPAVYLEPDAWRESWARLSPTGTELSPTRLEVKLWQYVSSSLQSPSVLGSWDARGVGLGAWTLSPHHVLDIQSSIVHEGDGTTVAAPEMIRTVAGDGNLGNDPNITGMKATDVRLCYPYGVAAGADGAVFIAEYFSNRVIRIEPSQEAFYVANSHGACAPFQSYGEGFSGDGGRAIAAALSGPEDVDVGPNGSIFVMDSGNRRIRRITPDGIINTIAGGGSSTADNIDALEARLDYTSRIAAAPDDGVLVSSVHRLRKVTSSGIIYSIAGTGVAGFAGDGGPAILAQLKYPRGMAIAPNGTIFVADSGNNRIREITPDGLIHTVAGNGIPGNSGDGGQATAASLELPSDVALAADGSLFVLEGYPHQQIRRIWPDGTITCVAGKGDGNFTGDLGPPLSAAFLANSITIGPEGSLYIADTANKRVRRMDTGLSAASSGNILVPSADASEVFAFDARGRHLSTRDPLTGATRLAFNYGQTGLLAGIVDADGNGLVVERDGDGNPTAIISPNGQRTTLTLDGNGYLASATNPAGETTRFSYDEQGLLTQVTDPRQNAKHLTYDEFGRLVRHEDAVGASKEFSRVEEDDHLAVTVTTAAGRAATYVVDDVAVGGDRRTVTESGCACAVDETINGADSSRTTRARDGTVSATTVTGDPRFGMRAPYMRSSTVTVPSGLRSSTSAIRGAILTDPLDPFSLTRQTDWVTANGKTTTTVYKAETRTTTTTSPAGRNSMTRIDAAGRIVEEQLDGLAPVMYEYDARGELATVTQGARESLLAYDPLGHLESITDPAGRTTSFTYDLAARVTRQRLPDGREISFTYDPVGNVTSITPPGRPPHVFTYTPVDLQQSYTPPAVGIGPTATAYAYDLDRQLTRITRPDGKQVSFEYDATGKLATIVGPRGPTTFAYNAFTGQLDTVTAPGGGTLSYDHDGFLETGVTWMGTVSGSTERVFNSDFRVVQTTVNGADPVAYSYDADGLVTGAGPLVLTRDPVNGLVAGTSVGSVADSRTYNPYGEMESYSAVVNGSPVLIDTYERDDLGRITRKRETIEGVVTTFEYGYDNAGRLVEVVKTLEGGSPFVTGYSYDFNGNRLSKTDATGTVSGVYDDQDRLLQYGDTSYTYNANGDLESKTQNGATVDYDYDVFGNLRHVALDNGIEINYVIDGRNRRIGKTVNGTLVQGFLYDDQLRIAAELDGSGAVVSRFAYGTHVNVPELMIRGTTTYRIITDHLGSPRLIIDTTDGSITQRMDYDAWGIVTLDTNPGFQPFGFAGGLYDPQTKLVRFGARDYDAYSGRWTTKDPIRFGGGDYNLFSYVANLPDLLTDPKGKDWVDWIPPFIPGGACIKCDHYHKKCYKDVKRCIAKNYDWSHMSDEDLAAVYSDSGIQHPEWNQCLKQQTSCQKMGKWCSLCARPGKVPGWPVRPHLF